jgi:hypothetical protein
MTTRRTVVHSSPAIADERDNTLETTYVPSMHGIGWEWANADNDNAGWGDSYDLYLYDRWTTSNHSIIVKNINSLLGHGNIQQDTGNKLNMAGFQLLKHPAHIDMSVPDHNHHKGTCLHFSNCFDQLDIEEGSEAIHIPGMPMSAMSMCYAPSNHVVFMPHIHITPKRTVALKDIHVEAGSPNKKNHACKSLYSARRHNEQKNCKNSSESSSSGSLCLVPVVEITILSKLKVTPDLINELFEHIHVPNLAVSSTRATPNHTMNLHTHNTPVSDLGKSSTAMCKELDDVQRSLHDSKMVCAVKHSSIGGRVEQLEEHITVLMKDQSLCNDLA